MKKHILTLASLLALGTLSAQVRTVNSATNVSVTNSPAFIDASSNTTVNGSANVGKGLIFPRVDLSAMTAFPGVTAGIANSFPTRFDGMIVYNTASSGTAGVGSTQGTLSPGYWYYDNKSATNTGGTWKPMGASVEPWYNAATNTAATGNTQDVYQMGKVGVGTATPGSSLDVKGSLAAQYNAVTATSYAMTATDYHVSYNGTANAAFTLPAAVAGAGNFKGRMYTIKNNTAFTITITPAGSETINGTPSLTLAANQSVQMINTGLTGAAATWEVLGYNSTSTTGLGCVQDYVIAGLTTTRSVGTTATNVLFNSLGSGSTVPYNITTGVFTLTAGKTYQLDATAYLYNFSNGTNAWGTFYWADAASGTQLANSSIGVSIPATYAGASSPGALATHIYTPSTNQNVVLKVVTTDGTATLGVGATVATIKQLNACGGNSSNSTAVTASNGLTASTGDVKLGGTLSQATDIATSGNNLTISGTGNVGIGTIAPTENLDVSGTARLRTIPSSGGTVMLTADNNGVIRKQALPVASAPALKADISSSGISLSTTGPAGYSNTGFGITLPANSKYMIQAYQILRTANANYQVPAGQSVWVQATLTDSPTSTTSSADIMGGQYFSGTYSASMSLNMMSGVLTINNTSNSAKTYYLAVRLGLVSGGLNTTLTELGNSGTSENQLIAIPIN